MSLLNLDISASVHEKMRFLFESGEDVVLHAYSDGQLSRQLMIRFHPRFRVKQFLKDRNNAHDDGVIVFESRSFLLEKAPNNVKCLCIHDNTIPPECLQHINDNQVNLDILILERPVVCTALWSIKVDTLMCVSWGMFECIFNGSVLVHNKTIRNVAISSGQVTSDCLCRLNSRSPLSGIKEPILQSLTLLLPEHALDNDEIESILMTLHSVRIARHVVLNVKRKITPSQLFSFLSLAGLTYFQASTTLSWSTSRHISWFVERIEQICAEKRTLVGGRICFDTEFGTPPRVERTIDLQNVFRKNRNVQLSRRLVDIVLVFEQFSLPAYVILWIVDFLYEFCFFDSALKVRMIQRVLWRCGGAEERRTKTM